MARYFQQNLGFLRDFGHQTWFGPRTHATSNGLRKTLAETLGWRSSCIVWMTCPSWIVTIVDFDDFRPTQFLDFFLFSPCILIFSLRLWMILYIYIPAAGLTGSCPSTLESSWQLTTRTLKLGSRWRIPEFADDFWTDECVFFLWEIYWRYVLPLLTPLNIFKEHLTDFPSWMMMMMIKLDFHILLRLAKTC